MVDGKTKVGMAIWSLVVGLVIGVVILDKMGGGFAW